MKQKLQRMLTLSLLIVIAVTGINYIQGDSLEDHLEARIKRKERKKLLKYS